MYTGDSSHKKATGLFTKLGISRSKQLREKIKDMLDTLCLSFVGVMFGDNMENAELPKVKGL